jgi:hypothetical protein
MAAPEPVLLELAPPPVPSSLSENSSPPHAAVATTPATVNMTPTIRKHDIRAEYARAPALASLPGVCHLAEDKRRDAQPELDGRGH